MKYLSKYWWVFLIRALLLLAIGIIAVTAPNMQVDTLVFYLGFLSLAMLVLSGLIVIMLIKDQWRWIPFAIFAAFDGVLGYYCLFKTSAAAQVFTATISIWAVLMGLGLVAMAFKQKGIGRIVLVLNGVLSLVFAGFVFFNPLHTTSILFMLGFYTILLSLFLIYLSFRILQSGNARKNTALMG